MTTSNTHQKLIAASGKAAPRTGSPPLADYIRNAVHLPDAKLAAEMVSEQAGLEFDTSAGQAFPRLETEKAELDTRFARSRAELESLEQRLHHTPRILKRANEARLPFARWARKDQAAMVLLVPALSVVMLMGASNTYANLMASGEPVFLDKPWLAVSLSALVPCGSTALKFVSHFFHYAYLKKRYALGVYVATFGALIVWAAHFALHFTGVAGGIDWAALGESDGGKGPALVFLQLLCEILIAGALFLAIEEVGLTYNPAVYAENPEFGELDKAYRQHRQAHEQLAEQRGRVTVELATLRNSRQQLVNNRLIEYHAYAASNRV